MIHRRGKPPTWIKKLKNINPAKRYTTTELKTLLGLRSPSALRATLKRYGIEAGWQQDANNTHREICLWHGQEIRDRIEDVLQIKIPGWREP